MAGMRMSMRKIREVLRLTHELGLSVRQVPEATGVGKTAVSEYVSRARVVGITWPVPPEISDAELERRLFTPAGFHEGSTKPLSGRRPRSLRGTRRRMTSYRRDAAQKAVLADSRRTQWDSVEVLCCGYWEFRFRSFCCWRCSGTTDRFISQYAAPQAVAGANIVSNRKRGGSLQQLDTRSNLWTRSRRKDHQRPRPSPTALADRSPAQ
jgi:hypothetical protein